VVASAFHQCFKYYQDGEKKISDDVKPLTKAESYFANVRFFEEGATLKEAMSATIFSTGKRGLRSAKDTHASSNVSTNSNIEQQ